MVINQSTACQGPADRKTNTNTGYVSGFVEINLAPSWSTCGCLLFLWEGIITLAAHWPQQLMGVVTLSRICLAERQLHPCHHGYSIHRSIAQTLGDPGKRLVKSSWILVWMLPRGHSCDTYRWAKDEVCLGWEVATPSPWLCLRFMDMLLSLQLKPGTPTSLLSLETSGLEAGNILLIIYSPSGR